MSTILLRLKRIFSKVSIDSLFAMVTLVVGAISVVFSIWFLVGLKLDPNKMLLVSIAVIGAIALGNRMLEYLRSDPVPSDRSHESALRWELQEVLQRVSALEKTGAGLTVEGRDIIVSELKAEASDQMVWVWLL